MISVISKTMFLELSYRKVKTKLFRHHNLFITLFLGFKPISVLAIFKLCYNESKVYRHIPKVV